MDYNTKFLPRHLNRSVDVNVNFINQPYKISTPFFLSLLFVMVSIYTTSSAEAQCSGGTAAGSITPSNSWQTVCIQGGNYVTFSGYQGVSYTFSFCSNGGSASYDTEITILDNSGNPVSNGYNDDYCGYASQITYVPGSSTTFRILVTQYGCTVNATCVTMAYRMVVPDEPCTATYLGPTCGSTYTMFSNTGSTNSSIASPGCAGYNGKDVWIKTVVPFSGALNFNTDAGEINDGGMAVYKGTCPTSLTKLGCDDDNGPGYMPYLSYTGLNPGDTLFVRVWAYNAAQSGSFKLNINDPNPTYCMTGSAYQLFSPGGCLHMTSNTMGQSACVWNKTQINMASAFDYNFTINLGNNDAGADGVTFTLQNSPAGMNALGVSGGSLGMQGVPNSVIVEFDTYNNGAGANDIADDHTAISLNGNVTAPVAGPVDASATSTNIEDGLTHNVRIKWDPTTKTMSVYFDGSLRLSYTNDLVANVFGSNMVYWGFSASTGLFTNDQVICPGNLPGAPMPVTWTNFTVAPKDENVILTWGTSEEKSSNVYYIERGTDIHSFQPIGEVKAAGNSKTNINYTFIDFSSLSGLVYYRIKEVDIDGNISYSDIRSIENSGAEITMKAFPNPIQTEGELTISINIHQKSVSHQLTIFDGFGQEVFRSSVHPGENSIKLPETMSSGVYHIYLATDEKVFSEKLIVQGK